MNRFRPLPSLLATALLAALPLASAFAQQPPPRPERPPSSEQHPQDSRRGSMSDAVRGAVERNNRGEVLSAERVQYDGRDMHRVKVVDDQGRVRVFMQDPQRRNDSGNRPSRNDGGDRGSSARRSSPARDDD